MAKTQDLRKLLGCSPSSDHLSSYLKDLSCLVASQGIPTPETKAYPDALYTNYFQLGISLLFVPKDTSKSIIKDRLTGDELKLDSIDVYNVPRSDLKATAKPAAGASAYSPYPVTPITLSLSPAENDETGRPAQLELGPLKTGKDIVQCLGEPERKGGGTGPSSGSIGIWCEWSKDGIMVEFGGDEARGPQAWERGKDAIWRVLTLFQRKAS